MDEMKRNKVHKGLIALLVAGMVYACWSLIFINIYPGLKSGNDPHPVAETPVQRVFKLIKPLVLPKKTNDTEHINLIERTNHSQMQLNSIPRAVALWTTWRSGSTFIGKMLANALPDTFYSIEPLHKWGVKIMEANSSRTEKARTYMQDLLHCRLNSTFQKQVCYLIQQKFYKEANKYLIQHSSKKEICKDMDIFNKWCKEANIHVLKPIRLSLKWAESLMKDEDVNLQIIYLARDPRAVLLSRSKVRFCGHPSCRDPKKVCSLLANDIKEGKRLEKLYPKKFKILQYEHLARDQEMALEDIMSFIGLPVSNEQIQLLHPKNLSNGTFDTNKDSRKQMDKWRTVNAYEFIEKIQNNCEEAISLLNLRLFHSEIEYNNISLPMMV